MEGYGLKITQLERVLHFLSVYLLLRIKSFFTIVIETYITTKVQIPLAEDDVLYLHAQHFWSIFPWIDDDPKKLNKSLAILLVI
jgi:hypothetical protein